MGRHDDDEEKKIPYRIQKRRLGTIRYVNPDGEFGFIEAEDFREDVFFHRTVWEGWGTQRDVPVMPPQEFMWVEFELDDDKFEQDKKLRAKSVRLSRRPEGKKLSGRDAPHLVIKHHPNARKKRPTWRG